MLGNRLRIGPAVEDGRVQIELRGRDVGSLAAEIAGIGTEIEVQEPAEMRKRLAEIGAELGALYN